MVKNNSFIRLFTIVVLLSGLTAANDRAIKKAVKKYAPTIIELRHQIHQNPEMGNREFKTAKIVANHLNSLGMEVTTGVAHTGVIGLLKGGKPGPVVGVRADMDGLPVTENTDLPFKIGRAHV